VTTIGNKDFLKNLQKSFFFKANDFKVLLVHGSPRRINEYLFEFRSEDSLRRMLKPLDIDVLVCGHTHKPYHRIIDTIHIVNDGSVGKPKDGDNRACYVDLDFTNKLKVGFKRVKYPVREVASKIMEVGLLEEFTTDILSGGLNNFSIYSNGKKP
jgi:putative phosphoesterase